MDIRQNPLWLSFPIGTYFQTEVKVSVWFILLALLFCAKLGLHLGLLITAIVFVSIMLHEFGHVIAARRSGGSGNEILIWPLGGLAFVHPAQNFISEFWTVAAGPLVQFLICLLCVPILVNERVLADCLTLLTLPPVDLYGNFPLALLMLTFFVNLQLLVLNLLPIYPLDGGQMAYHVSKLKWDRQSAKVGTLWVGMILSLIVMVFGVGLKSVDLVFLGSILMMLGSYEHLTAQVNRPLDDSFMGYDFSQGYTSLEHHNDREERHAGVIERWKSERNQRKQEKEHQLKLETERRVDELLDKVHQHGMNSLTDSERRFLQRASGHYRSHGKD